MSGGPRACWRGVCHFLFYLGLPLDEDADSMSAENSNGDPKAHLAADELRVDGQQSIQDQTSNAMHSSHSEVDRPLDLQGSDETLRRSAAQVMSLKSAPCCGPMRLASDASTIADSGDDTAGKLPKASDSGAIADSGDDTAGKLPKAKFIDVACTGNIQECYALDRGMVGEGSYSTVCVGCCRETGVNRAVKTISKRELENPAAFYKEMQLTKSLNHPNIIKVFETFEDQRNLYLILELCTGGEMLSRVVEVGDMSEVHASTLMKQVCLTVKYLHFNRVCHRDLKPENFIFTEKGSLDTTNIKLIDFGLSRRFLPGKVMTTAVGTVLYVAPEVFSQAYSEVCDMWSCGVMVFFLLCGCHPFDGATAKQVAKSVRKGIFTFNDDSWEHVSGDAQDFIRKLLRKDPGVRLTADQALTDPWISAGAPQASGQKFGPKYKERMEEFLEQNQRARSVAKSWQRH